MSQMQPADPSDAGVTDADATDVEDVDVVDVVVIGLGPGGEDVAGKLAEAGLAVVGVDSGLVGGECPYWGCVPSKMMIRAADLLAEARRVPGMSGSATVVADWSPVAQRIRADATDDWNDQVAVDRLVAKGATFVRGRGRLESRQVVSVATDEGVRRFRARRGIVVGTGTAPAIPPIDGLRATPYWTNHDVIEMKELPGSIVVLGGGAIGVELAQVMARFGATVTVVEAAPRLVPLEEPEAGALLADIFEREGITVIAGVGAQRVAHDHDGFSVTLADGRIVSAERLLVATGRKTDLATIGAEVLGVDVTTARSLPVDEHLRVGDGVWALGDITGKGAFTHVSMYQAGIVVADILGQAHEPAAYHALPRVTFTDPEIGSVGMSQEAASAAGVRVGMGTTQVPSTSRGWMHKVGNEGFIKVVADLHRDVLVGATSMGPNGGEVLGLLALAVHARVPLAQLRTMIYAYPTFHRGIEDALRNVQPVG